ncbi:MAG: ABC transporter permease, partial [Planctomycetota bacterium]
VFGIGATVAVLAGMLSLQQGFATMFAERGREDLAVFLRRGATSEGESAFSRDRAQILIKNTAEIQDVEYGQPLASAELYLAIRRFKVDGGETNVPIRGVQPMTYRIHGDEFRIVQGRRPAPGADEVIVGQKLTDRIRNCQIGDELRINIGRFRVVGVFQSKGGYASEIWGDADRLMAALQRSFFSRVIGVLRNPKDLPALAARLENDKQVPAKVLNEKDYLKNQTRSLSTAFIWLGAFLGVIMGIGAVFTGTNAMLSALDARTHEIGILLSIGFRPWAVFVAFLLEATLVGMLGGVFGCLLVLPLNGMQAGTTNFETFSEVVFAFRTTPTVLLVAVLFSMGLGLLGGAIPAWKAAGLPPTAALRRG